MTAIEVLNSFLKGKKVRISTESITGHEKDTEDVEIVEIEKDCDWEWIGLKVVTSKGDVIRGLDIDTDIFIT